jgi:hypothetical protein
MADYFPLLARALDTMSDRSPETRRIVYDRARSALLSQLRSLDPPLGEPEIEREKVALDEAIARAETVYGADAAPLQAPEPEPELHAPSEPEIDPAPHARIIGQPAIRRGGSRNRSLVLAIGLLIVMVPVAVVGWLWRDRPSPAPQEVARVEPVAPAAPVDSKFADRIGGPARTVAPVPVPTAPSPTPAPVVAPTQPPRAENSARTETPTQPAAPAVQPELAVAQRALLVEENTTDAQQPKITPGRALWRIDALNAGQGQPLETVVRATVDVPEAGLSLSMTLRRNTDPAFPASHTIEMIFTSASAGNPDRVVRDVALPQLKPEETVRGIPLAGLSVPVKENIFLIGLSDLKSDTDRNSDLLLTRNWIDLPLRFSSGARAVLSFEKGVSGERVLADAFRQWSPPQ